MANKETALALSYFRGDATADRWIEKKRAEKVQRGEGELAGKRKQHVVNLAVFTRKAKSCHQGLTTDSILRPTAHEKK